MRRHLRLYGAFFQQHLKALLEYRLNALIAILSSLTFQGAYIAAVLLIMARVPSLGGWGVDEVLLMYGLFGLGAGLQRMFTDNLLFFGAGQVRTGVLDRMLVRPVNPLFHLIANRVSYEGAGDVLVALIILVRAMAVLAVPLNPATTLYIIAIVAAGAVISFSLFLLATTLTFWITVATPFALMIGHTRQYVRYPLSIYTRGIQRLFTWGLPFGLVSFYPAQFLLGRGGGGVMPFMAFPVAAALFLLATRFWTFGLRRYTGAGS